MKINAEFNPFLIEVIEEAQKVADQSGIIQFVYIDKSDADFAYSSEMYFKTLKPRPRKIASIKPNSK